MIILKILLYVLLVVLGIAVLVIIFALAFPAVVKVNFVGGKLEYKVKFSIIPLMDSGGGGLLNRLRKSRKKSNKPELDEEDVCREDEFSD
ncbi:MAG: hypothetical protein K2J44_07220, partial [Ruminococcus sp.]|nr:hypothetical protein [Ruminococcus sp.]